MIQKISSSEMSPKVISYPSVTQFLSAIQVNDTATMNHAIWPLYGVLHRDDAEVGDDTLRLGLWQGKRLE